MNQQLSTGDEPMAQHEEQPDAPRGWRRAVETVAQNMHYFTFAPLIVMSVLQDVHLLLAACISTAIVASLLLGGFFLWHGQYIKVYPKPYDIFNLCLYGSFIPLALLAHDWLLTFASLLINGGNALFMLATILLPFDNFVMVSVRDRVPERLWNSPLLRRMALAIALTWTTALSIMTLGAVLLLAMRVGPKDPGAINMGISYGLGFGPLLLAFPTQMLLTRYYRRRLVEEGKAAVARQQQQQGEKGEGKAVAEVMSNGGAVQLTDKAKKKHPDVRFAGGDNLV